MERKVTATASIILLLTILGAADAGAAGRAPRFAGSPSAQDAPPFDAFNSGMSASVVEPGNHRYHGGPKSGDWDR